MGSRSRFVMSSVEQVFDYFHRRWERKATFVLVSQGLILAFLLGLALAEAKRLGWLAGTRIEEHIYNHFFAIELAFTLLLLTELLSLVFTMPNSIAESVGKQFTPYSSSATSFSCCSPCGTIRTTTPCFAILPSS